LEDPHDVAKFLAQKKRMGNRVTLMRNRGKTFACSMILHEGQMARTPMALATLGSS